MNRSKGCGRVLPVQGGPHNRTHGMAKICCVIASSCQAWSCQMHGKQGAGGPDGAHVCDEQCKWELERALQDSSSSTVIFVPSSRVIFVPSPRVFFVLSSRVTFIPMESQAAQAVRPLKTLCVGIACPHEDPVSTCEIGTLEELADEQQLQASCRGKARPAHKALKNPEHWKKHYEIQSTRRSTEEIQSTKHQEIQASW